MKKTAFFGLLAIVVCCVFLVGCNDISKQVANEKKLLEDVSNIDSLKNCFKSDFVYESEYICKDLEIIKRQTNAESKQDTVYCNVEMENDYFNALLEVVLTYGYYDVGGWIFDECDWEIINVKPLRAPEYELVISAIVGEGETEDGLNVYIPAHNETYYISSSDYTIISIENQGDHVQLREVETPSRIAYTVRFNIPVKFKYFTASTDLSESMFFDMNGWKLPNKTLWLTEIDQVLIDTSEMRGEYEYQRKKPGGRGATLLVFDVDFYNFTIECEYDYIHYKWADFWSGYDGQYQEKIYDGTTKIININPFQLSIKIADLGHQVSDSAKLNFEPNELRWKDNFNGKHYNDGIRDFDYLLKIKSSTVEQDDSDYSVSELVDESVDVDEYSSATIQANVSNWGLACKAKDKVFYSDVCTGIYIHNQNGETLFTEGVYTDLYYSNNKIYCVEDVEGKLTLVSFDYDTKEKQVIYTPKSESAVIIVYNTTSENLYFSVDEQLFYMDPTGNIIDTGIFNVVNVTDSGIYSKTTPKFGLKLTTFENVVIKKFTCVDDYNVIVFFEKDGFVYVELTDEDYTSREYARIALGDGTIEKFGGLLDNTYRGINVKNETIYFTSFDETTLNIYRASLSFGNIEKIYSTEIEGGIWLGLVSIIGDEIFAVSPYSASGVKILDINSF